MLNDNRRPLAKISMFGITYLQIKNPYMVAWWSAIFPGFGHLLLNQYIRGTLLTLSEVAINSLSNLNQAMVYSFCGHFEQAISVLHPNWALGYIPVYLFAIWDSYRSTLYQNKLCHLAELAPEPLPTLGIFTSEIQYLERKNPTIAAIYSFLFPGLGQLYNHRFGLAFYAMFWWWFYAALSQLYGSLQLLLTGQLAESIEILKPHWLLFMPSVMGGSIYFAYHTANSYNRLYRLEQRRYLIRRYRDSEVILFDPAGRCE